MDRGLDLVPKHYIIIFNIPAVPWVLNSHASRSEGGRAAARPGGARALMPLAASKTKAVLAVRKQAYRWLAVRAGSLRYFDRLRDFIHLHGSAHVNIMLVGLAVEACAALDALRAEAHGYQCHFHVKDTQELAYGIDKREPEGNTLYWAMDQKD